MAKRNGAKPTASKGNGRRVLRSHAWFGKLDRDGLAHRSWMKNQGLPHHLFDGRPVIGICNTWSELTPCNAHFRDLADHVKRGVYEMALTELARFLPRNDQRNRYLRSSYKQRDRQAQRPDGRLQGPQASSPGFDLPPDASFDPQPPCAPAVGTPSRKNPS